MCALSPAARGHFFAQDKAIRCAGRGTDLNQVGDKEMYACLIRKIKDSGYNFATMIEDDNRHGGRTFRMRHDVDISPHLALELSEVESSLGVKSTYYFQLNADTYSCLGESTLSAIALIRSAGHCVGLHIDQTVFGDQERVIQDTLNWFSSCVTPIDNTCSFHRPSPTVVGKTFGSFSSAYDPRWFSPQRYLSDSRRSFAFLEGLDRLMTDGVPQIQLLTHPEWWGGHTTSLDVYQCLESRRRRELVANIKSNFPSVFGEVPDAEDRNPRL
jgi:hypothetical protein